MQRGRHPLPCSRRGAPRIQVADELTVCAFFCSVFVLSLLNAICWTRAVCEVGDTIVEKYGVFDPQEAGAACAATPGCTHFTCLTFIA